MGERKISEMTTGWPADVMKERATDNGIVRKWKGCESQMLQMNENKMLEHFGEH